jgi:hypothetical protein
MAVLAALASVPTCRALAAQTSQGADRSPYVSPANTLTVELFVRDDSDFCRRAVDYLRGLQSSREGVRAIIHDVAADPAALERFWTLSRRFRVKNPIVPLFYACDVVKVGFSTAEASGPEVDKLLQFQAFVREGCGHCRDAKAFLRDLHRRWPGLDIVFHDVIRDQRAQQQMQNLANHFQTKVVSLPCFYFCGRFLVGFESAATTGRGIEQTLQESQRRHTADFPTAARVTVRDSRSDLAKWPDDSLAPSGFAALLGPAMTGGADDGLPPSGEAPVHDAPGLNLPGDSTDLADDATEESTYGPPPSEPAPEGIDVPVFGRLQVTDVGLPAFTFLIGLVDGFNPCAMWVLILLLSILVNVRNRKRIIAIAGTFVLVSGLAYFAFMAAWLNLFMVVKLERPAELALGGLALVIGIINVKDFIAFHQGISLSIPAAAKPGIYARIHKIVTAKYLTAALVSAVLLAIFVNVVELLCTAGLPAVYTKILTKQQLPAWSNYAYLALYDVGYMLDDTLMVSAVVVTLSHRRLQEREGRWLKLLSGVVILVLGIVMILRPEWLEW